MFFNLDFDMNYVFIPEDVNSREEYVNWSKITDFDKQNIKNKLDKILNELDLLGDEVFTCSAVRCKKKRHRKQLDRIFQLMKIALLESTSDFNFDKVKKYKIIPGWNQYVKEFHAVARSHFLKWKDKGKPKTGIYVANMKESRAKFRNEFNKCKDNEENIRKDRLAGYLRNKNHKEFWREIDSQKQSNVSQPSSIDRESNPQLIANNFSQQYKLILDKDKNGKSSAEQCDTESCNNNQIKIIHRVTKNDIKQAIKKLKCSIGSDSVHSNHLKDCTESFIDILASFFTSLSSHEHTPVDLLRGTITPTVKDRYGNRQDSSNYRPVMSSSVFLKLLEYCILAKIKPFVVLDDRQHGFRDTYSTSTACFVFKETVMNYFKSNSKVYACFLDISKAFDSVKHSVLIRKLLEYGIPSSYVNLIKSWYSNQYVKVRYQDKYSEEWKICNGVRQGGVLSGFLFGLYIDSVLKRISNLKIGCRLGLINSNVIAYADDIVLLAPSPTALQIMMDVTYDEASKLDLAFNTTKSKVMVFSPNRTADSMKRIFKIGDDPVACVKSFRYLGYQIQHNLDNSLDIDEKRGRFYSQFNQVLRKFHYLDKNVLLFLFQQFCLQIYGAELWFGNNRSVSNLNQFAIGYHKAIKKILGVSYHESNHYVCQEAKLFTFENLINKVKLMYRMRICTKPCSFIQKLLGYFTISSVLFCEIDSLALTKYGMEYLMENDRDGVLSRIAYIQNHETQMRVEVVNVI